ncbi:hypothetical protein [Bacillus sp. OK048]|uniref:hypothetical protein n=1 Tax=Bacillus sp. OK048 TaxID=1882761 RepID=UPI000880355F|nr:hypothetical protein [Bacillus sp. OK048]SDM41161.1 hypothetical protein SAMN05443253_103221 [Bacillus sp. OK048]
MKRFVLPCVLGLTLLVGCQNTEPKEKVETKQSTKKNQQMAATNKDNNTTFPYPNLLAENEQSYSLLVIGEHDEDIPIEKNTKITEKVNDILSLPELEMAQKAYPDLNIKTEPAYILFDQAGVIHQSKDLEELTTFLGKNSPK